MNHRTGLKALTFLSLPVLLIMGLENRDGVIEPKLAQYAEAVIGVPVSPMSVGGVARRTTRRTVAYTSTASASAAASSAAAADAAAAEAAAAEAEAAAASAAAQSQPAAAPLPAGSVVTALPSGCTSMTIDGGSYFSCGGTIFKPTFQSNNLVYIVQ